MSQGQNGTFCNMHFLWVLKAKFSSEFAYWGNKNLWSNSKLKLENIQVNNWQMWTTAPLVGQSFYGGPADLYEFIWKMLLTLLGWRHTRKCPFAFTPFSVIIYKFDCGEFGFGPLVLSLLLAVPTRAWNAFIVLFAYCEVFWEIFLERQMWVNIQIRLFFFCCFPSFPAVQSGFMVTQNRTDGAVVEAIS